MKRIITVVVALAVLSSCGNYTLIEAKRRDINTFYSVHPQIEWNALRTSNFEVWTVDGVDLAAIYFVKGLKDGETLFEPKRGTEVKEWPSFRKYMKGSEVAELVVDSMSAAGLSFVESSGLRPAQFGEQMGFRFELRFLTPNGLQKKGLTTGALSKERLYLVIYLGAAEHYYEKYETSVERLIDSIDTL